MRSFLRAGLSALLLAIAMTTGTPAMAQTPLPTFTAVANQPNASPFFVEFFRQFNRDLHGWWMREGAGLVKVSWQVNAQEALAADGTREGILLILVQASPPKYSVIRIRATQDPAAAAGIAASTVIGVIERGSGKEVTKK